MLAVGCGQLLEDTWSYIKAELTGGPQHIEVRLHNIAALLKGVAVNFFHESTVAAEKHGNPSMHFPDIAGVYRSLHACREVSEEAMLSKTTENLTYVSDPHGFSLRSNNKKGSSVNRELDSFRH